MKRDKAVWESDLKSEQKFILLALFHVAEEDGYTVYCTKQSVANKTGLSERTVQRQLRRLEKLGWIELIEEARHHLPRVYKIKNSMES